MNTPDNLVPRLCRLHPAWTNEFHAYLKQDADIFAAIPNEEGRRFSVWAAHHLIPEPAMKMLDQLGLDLHSLRNFRLDGGNRHATMLHRDHPSNPCFAVNICIRGSIRAHFYKHLAKPVLNQETESGSNPVFFSTKDPDESYEVQEGELFIMDTSTIHQADTSNYQNPVLLASFVPKPQYRYEDALKLLGLA